MTSPKFFQGRDMELLVSLPAVYSIQPAPQRLHPSPTNCQFWVPGSCRVLIWDGHSWTGTTVVQHYPVKQPPCSSDSPRLYAKSPSGRGLWTADISSEEEVGRGENHWPITWGSRHSSQSFICSQFCLRPHAFRSGGSSATRLGKTRERGSVYILQRSYIHTGWKLPRVAALGSCMFL